MFHANKKSKNPSAILDRQAHSKANAEFLPDVPPENNVADYLE
jgi:hypothetical protein